MANQQTIDALLENQRKFVEINSIVDATKQYLDENLTPKNNYIISREHNNLYITTNIIATKQIVIARIYPNSDNRMTIYLNHLNHHYQISDPTYLQEMAKLISERAAYLIQQYV